MTEDADPERRRSPPDSFELWPFGARAALLAAPALWLAIGVILWISNQLVDWPTSATSGGLLYVVAVIGLVPVVLVVLQEVAKRGGSVTTRWGGIDFGKGIEAGQRRAATVPTDLGLPGEAVTDSSVAKVHETLAISRANEVVRLDLGTGDQWWMTRLFALCVGATRNRAPRILVFVGRQRGVDEAFIGWVRPTEALRLLSSEREHLRTALDRAEAIGRYITTAETPIANLPFQDPPLVKGPRPGPLDPPLAAQATNYAQHPSFHHHGEETALYVLLDLLGKYEMKQDPVGGERVTVGVLDDVLGEALHEERIDVQWSDQRQLDEFLATTDDYLGITDGGAFQRIVAHRALTNALLRQLLESDHAAA